ncbi:MAG: hypothetical protein ACFE9D_09880 [Promethearchaeota archaeon]
MQEPVTCRITLNAAPVLPQICTNHHQIVVFGFVLVGGYYPFIAYKQT